MDAKPHPVSIELPVLWGDMDALGHVNNAVYARWLEQARIQYFQRVALLGMGSVGPILARQAIDFRKPVAYPDRVTIEVGVKHVGNTSVVLGYEIRNSEGVVVVEAESVIVLIDYATGAKTPVSPELRERIDAVQAERA
ncbi:MAG: thioesterase family protein [Polyangiaceae bacterium]